MQDPTMMGHPGTHTGLSDTNSNSSSSNYATNTTTNYATSSSPIYATTSSNNNNNNNNNNNTVNNEPTHIYDCAKSKKISSADLLVKASLPDQQHTTVRCPQGWTLRQSFIKALSSRGLVFDHCKVYRTPIKGGPKQAIDWDVDVSMLRGYELTVERIGTFLTGPRLSHNFDRLGFSLSKCEFCHELLMKSGLKCLSCAIEFHRGCYQGLPALCRPKLNDEDQYKYLLARQNKFPDSDYERGLNSSTLDGITNVNNLRTNHPSVDLTLQTDQNHLSNYTEYHPLSPSQVSQNRELLEEKWEIDGDEITRGERIGQGSFATVYKGHWHGPVALKKLNIANPTQKQLQKFRHEVVLLRKIRHPNVLLFSGYSLKPELQIVTQWCKGLSLHKHLHIEASKDFNTLDIKKISQGIAQGMDYLHAKGIIHRDLKSNNVFIHDEGDLTVKIGDFGLATFKTDFEGDQPIYHPTGSILWMAPEVIRCEKGVNPFTQESDVYSYGIVLYELLTRKLPYFDFKHKDALLYLIGLGDPKRSPKLNLDVIGRDKPKQLIDLMLDCTQRTPSSRPLFKKILDRLKCINVGSLIRSKSDSELLRSNNGSMASDLMNY